MLNLDRTNELAASIDPSGGGDWQALAKAPRIPGLGMQKPVAVAPGVTTDHLDAVDAALQGAPELHDIDPLKIVGLTIDAERLAEIRALRVRGMGGQNRQYAEMLEIYDELEEAAALHRRLGCPVIDVTGLSIEETAHRVIRLLDRRRAARLLHLPRARLA